jgi:hypothetical protein
MCQTWVNCDSAVEVLDHIPHRTTYGQNNPWVVHEIPVEWLPVRFTAHTLLEFHVPLTDCFVRRWFCVVRGPKPRLHCHNWLSFGKFQDTESFLIPCPHHVSSWLPPSGETCRHATVPRTQKFWEFLYLLIYSPSAWSSWLVYRRGQKSRRDLTNYPVFICSVNSVMNLGTEFGALFSYALNTKLLEAKMSLWVRWMMHSRKTEFLILCTCESVQALCFHFREL